MLQDYLKTLTTYEFRAKDQLIKFGDDPNYDTDRKDLHDVPQGKFTSLGSVAHEVYPMIDQCTG